MSCRLDRCQVLDELAVLEAVLHIIGQEMFLAVCVRELVECATVRGADEVPLHLDAAATLQPVVAQRRQFDVRLRGLDVGSCGERCQIDINYDKTNTRIMLPI